MRTIYERFLGIARLVDMSIKNGHNINLEYDKSGITVFHIDNGNMLKIDTYWSADCAESEQDKQEKDILTYLIHLNK